MIVMMYFFFFKQKTAYEMVGSDWSSDVCSSDLFIKRLLEQRGHSPKANPPRAIHAIISGAKNRMLLPEELGASAESPLERVAAEIYAVLGPTLKQANAMDFDDLLLLPLTLF